MLLSVGFGSVHSGPNCVAAKPGRSDHSLDKGVYGCINVAMGMFDGLLCTMLHALHNGL